MRNTRVIIATAFFLAVCAPEYTSPALAAPLTGARTASTLTITSNTEIPDGVLKPGTYNITILDHLTDRMIVQIDEGKGKANIFLAVPSSTLSVPVGGGAVLAESGKHDHALLGYAFPDGTVAEFVYPKVAAVAIAKRNNTTVPAVDPVSEGMPASRQLSSTDMRMITLWMLTPTRVGNSPAISAERFQPPVTLTASLPANRANSTLRSESEQPTEIAAVTPTPHHVLRVLPHTASALPVLWLLSGMSFLGAVMLGYFRRRAV